MFKKCILFSIFFSVLNLQAMDALKSLKYIPAKSEVRMYCEKNQTDNNCQTIAKFLEKMTDSKSNKQQMDCIESKIKKLKEEFSLAQSKQINNFDQYVNSKEPKWLLKKAILQEKYIPKNFPQKGKQQDKVNYNNAVDNVLKTIDQNKHEQEKQYLQQGFSNAYENKRPWNAYTTKEKTGEIVGWSAFVGFSALFYFMYLSAMRTHGHR